MHNNISKTILALCCTGLVCFMGFSQDTPEFPTVAPPTPTAAALHSFGNNSVSYYSGTVDVSIPIFTIQEGDIEVPIVLNYTGGSGIKVEEQGSWVGLGWSLNAGGAVSRTKRGVADEADNGRGFMSYSSVPAEETDGNGNLLNADFIADIAQGRKDSEPDRFMYNIPSGSGSFYIDFDSIIQKPYTDKRIAYSSGSGNYNDPINTNNCDNTSGLEAFHITDERGIYYTFEEKERSNSKNVLGNVFDYNCFPTSWQLTKITDTNSDLFVDFEYDAYYYSNIRLNPLVTGLNETESYVEDSFLAKPLKKIIFSNGSVEFVLASTSRKDIDGSYALDKIIIKDENNDTIKEFHFNYKYLTANALVDDSGSLSFSADNRMVLSSLQEVGTNGETLPPYNFTYNTSVYLPDTFSTAKDHWGYYNGKTSNTKYQAKQLARWYSFLNTEWVTTLIGSANREPDPTYAQAGILERVQYPTGGYTDYEYEGNEAVDEKLQAPLIARDTNLIQPNIAINIDVELHTAGATHTVMEIRAIQYPDDCYPIVRFENTSTNTFEDFSFEDETPVSGGAEVLEREVIIEAGNYDVSFWMQSSTVTCDPNFDYLILLNWENESSTPTKTVGGVRIKKIADYPQHGPSLSRTFEYLADDGESSGGVVSTPRYWFQNILFDEGTQTFVPFSLGQRSVTSQYPLINTGSNVVGYSKVTVTQHDGSNGKSEFYFTSPEDFPDKKMGYAQYNGQRDDFFYNGTFIESYPVVTENSREYLRGKLLKQIDYKYNGSTYDTIAFTENTYTTMAYDPDSPLGGQQFSGSKSFVVKGVKMVPTELIKEYEIHSGYIQLEKTVSKSYFDSGTVETTTLNKYPEDIDGAITYKMPIENEVVDSWGEKSITKSYYVFNAQDNTERDTGQDLITGTMASRNMVYAPTHSFSYRQEGTSPEEKISQQQTLYAQDGNGIILPQKIKTAKLANSLEDRLEFVAYDDRKNPLEIHRTDGPSTSFVWGYNGTKVIAKLDNVEMESTTLTTAQSNAISAAVTASDEDVNATTEDTLRQELEDLRAAFPTAMVTTFTYDLMVGVTSVTDPRGYTNYYGYDEFNRLKEVKDDEGNKVEDIKYHYQGQQ
ncbi:MAG: RHS repeat domain-containing protein [Flavobacteriaceae bacterium]